MMINPFAANPVQREFIQVKAKRGEPGAMPMTLGKTSFWVKTVPNPNYKPVAAAAAPPPAAPAPPSGPTAYKPEELVSNAPRTETKVPDAPAQMFSPGGIGADIESNAGGFRRKKSSAKMAGMTSKGTSQLKISGQSARSSGLNIGM